MNRLSFSSATHACFVYLISNWKRLRLLLVVLSLNWIYSLLGILCWLLSRDNLHLSDCLADRNALNKVHILTILLLDKALVRAAIAGHLLSIRHCAIILNDDNVVPSQMLLVILVTTVLAYPVPATISINHFCATTDSQKYYEEENYRRGHCKNDYCRG